MIYKTTSRYYIELDLEVEANSAYEAIQKADEIAAETDLRDWTRTICNDSIIKDDED